MANNDTPALVLQLGMELGLERPRRVGNDNLHLRADLLLSHLVRLAERLASAHGRTHLGHVLLAVMLGMLCKRLFLSVC